MSSAHRKVILRQFSGELVQGYLSGTCFVCSGSLDLLGLDGRRISLPLERLKAVFFVRDFNLADPFSPERLLRRTFLARPRGDGLWIRLTFRQDGDQIEGLAPSDLSLCDDLTLNSGLQFSPPDTRSNTQRIFVPRSAIAELRILAVITSPSRRQIAPSLPGLESPELSSQATLFPRSPLATTSGDSDT